MPGFEIKRHDRRPRWRVQLKHDGVPADITGNSSVKFIMKNSSNTIVLNKVAMTVVDAPTGVVEYAWQAGDTDTTGTFTAEVEIDWGGGEFETFPSNGYFTITVNDDLA